MKPSVLVAVGCSWVAGRCIDVDPSLTTYDFNHVEDPEFIKEHSFAGKLQRHLGLDQIHFIARNGASNEEQVRKLVAFIENERDQYSEIFVIWGITSIYRWEMYTTATEQVEPFVVGRVWPNNSQLTEQVKYYFRHFFNREYELEKLGNQIALMNSYLNSIGIKHLFFNSFNSYTNDDWNIKTVDEDCFYKLTQSHNDLLSFLCLANNIEFSKSSVPWLNLLKAKPDLQYHNRAVKELQNCGMLDRATAHPTVVAHTLIADELYNYIKG